VSFNNKSTRYAANLQILKTPESVIARFSLTSAFGDFLFLFFNLCGLARVCDSHGAGKTVSQFNFVGLFFDGLSHGEIVNVSQNEQGFDDPTEGLASLIERVLA